MATRHPNYRLVKTHRNYTVDEAARLLGVHRNTVRNWPEQGLERLDDGRPMLFLGRTLREFLKARREKAKQKCPPGHLYCVRCRSPRVPALGMLDYAPYTDTIGNLTGICPDCSALMNRRVSVQKLASARGELAVRFPDARRRISETDVASVNCDLKRTA